MNAASTNDDYDGYERLFADIRRRWSAPRKHPTYAFHFIGNFILFAAVSVWIELGFYLFGNPPIENGLTPLRSAIVAYFPAILGSVCLQLALSDTAHKSIRALCNILPFPFIAVSLVLISSKNISDPVAIFVASVTSILALCCCWIVNADDPALRDDTPSAPEDSSGGVDAVATLSGEDALSDFKY